MKQILYLLVMLGAVTSCIYSYQPDIEDKEVDDILVVDGEIILGGTSTFTLSRISPISGEVLAVPSCQAWIEDDAGHIYSSGSVLSSELTIDTGNAIIGYQYRARLRVDGEEYVSEWLTPKPAPEILDISFTATERMVNVMVSLDGGAEGTGYIGITVEETWEFHSEQEAMYIIDPQTWTYPPMMSEYPYYWCWRTAVPKDFVLIDYTTLGSSVVKDRNIYSFSRYDNRNHKKYSILVQARTLSPEAYAYRNYIQDLSQVGGDLFTPEPGMLKGNFHCESDPDKQVLGLVYAATLSTKRSWLGTTYQLQRPLDDSYLILLTQEQMPAYYFMGYRPVKDIVREDGAGIGWGPERCINCIVAGGTQEKPDFWDDADI